MKQMIIPLSIAGLGIFFLLQHEQPEKPAQILEVASHQSISLGSLSQENLPPASKKTLEARNYANLQQEKVSYKKIKQLLSCLKSESCALAQKDPRSYEMELSQQVLSELQHISQNPRSQNSEELQSLLRKTLTMDWAEIKIETIKILAQQKPDRTFVKPLLAHVIHQSQPDAIPYALQELSRFQNPTDQKLIHRELQKALITGSVFSALEIAKEIGPHLTEEQKKQYWKIHEKLLQTPLSSEIAKNLEQSLKR